MLKRPFWFAAGVGFGVSASYWMTKAVRETAARYAPERVTGDLADAVRGFSRDLRSAVAEGRSAMRERELDLRAGVDRHRSN